MLRALAFVLALLALAPAQITAQSTPPASPPPSEVLPDTEWPELSSYLEKDIGEKISFFCTDRTRMQVGEEGSCWGVTDLGRRYDVRFRIQTVQPEITADVLSLKRGQNEFPLGFVFKWGGRLIPLFGLAGAIAAIIGFTKLSNAMEASWVTAPLSIAETQSVSFDAPDSYTLYSEGPTLPYELKGMSMSLWDPKRGVYVDSLAARPTSDVARVRIPRVVYVVPRSGEFVLVLGNVDNSKSYISKLIFGRTIPMKRLLYGGLGVAGSIAFLFGLIIFVLEMANGGLP